MPFQKGQSGNPGGRPKGAGEVKSTAREYTQESIERLVHWMRSDDARASVPASNALLDRGWGKPAQAIIGGDDDDKPIKYERIERVIVDPVKVDGDTKNQHG